MAVLLFASEPTLAGVSAEQRPTSEEDTAPERECNWVVIILVPLCAGLAFGVFQDFFRRSCPKCCKEWGLRSTGEQRRLNEGIKGILRPTWVVQYKCKSCGYTVWKKIRSSGN
jgi:hypothetical protein